MTFWKRTMDYLGLGPDDAYDDDGYDNDVDMSPRSRRQPDPDIRVARAQRDDSSAEGVVRTLPSRPTFPSRDFDPSQSRRHPERQEREEPPITPSGSNGSPVRPQRPRHTGSLESTTVRPQRFNQAQEIADRFKEGHSVIMNLEGADREVSRRLIDFASGLCYGFDGTMEKVASGVYLLKPPAFRSSFDDNDL